MPRHVRRTASFRRRLYEILEHGSIGDRTGLMVGRLIVLLIVVNLVSMTLDSVPALQTQYGALFTAIELLSLVVFTIEYALRVWVAAEHAPARHSSERKARWKFVSSPLGVIDLLAVLPFWLAFVLPVDLRVLLVFCMGRFLKLARYSPAMRSLLDALYNERRALFGCFVILLGATLVTASIMHVIERHAQPEKFGTIPDAMWWAIVTLGTIGYGDVVPVTALGRFVASITIFVGLIMIALPIGIVATAFADEIHRRDFVVTWGMVARVPLALNCRQWISPISSACCTRSNSRPGTLSPDAARPRIPCISSRPEQWKSSSRTSASGHVFGEVRALRRTRRSATVTAVTRTSLLMLDAHDLHVLMDREPRIAERIREVARSRLGGEITPKGDLVLEELEEADTVEQSAPRHGSS